MRSRAASTGRGSGDLERATPLLRKGDERRADEIFTGPLADDIEGTLALYTYTEVSAPTRTVTAPRPTTRSP